MLALDHLVVAAERLEEGVAWAEERLGVQFEAGGVHARYGTHNALLGLANGVYLEVITRAPELVPESLPRWFGLDHFTGPPRLLTWVGQTRNLPELMASLPVGFSGIAKLSRGALRWQMAEVTTGSLPFDQCFPGVIDWGSSAHPSTRLAASGLRLTQLELGHPNAEGLSDALAKVFSDARVSVQMSEAPKLRAVLAREDGSEVRL